MRRGRIALLAFAVVLSLAAASTGATAQQFDIEGPGELYEEETYDVTIDSSNDIIEFDVDLLFVPEDVEVELIQHNSDVEPLNDGDINDPDDWGEPEGDSLRVPLTGEVDEGVSTSDGDALFRLKLTAKSNDSTPVEIEAVDAVERIDGEQEVPLEDGAQGLSRNLEIATHPEPEPDISVVDLRVREDEIYPEERAVIEAEAENTGTEDGDIEARLVVEGEEMDNRTVEVPEGETEEFDFWHRFEFPGDYDVEVGEESLDVEVLEEEDDNDSEDEEETEDDNDSAGSSEGLPGFGVPAALAALLGLSVARLVRR
ncbi:MAG: hypothetical protein ACOCT0_05380 [Halobacteriota archaeon]